MVDNIHFPTYATKAQVIEELNRFYRRLHATDADEAASLPIIEFIKLTHHYF